MGVTKNKNKVFRDYAAIIHGMLPEAQGLVFHNHLGKLFWRDSNIDNNVLTDAYKASLQNLLLSRAHDPLSCRVMMGDSAAYLLPIVNDNGSLLGALTVLLPRDAADLPYSKCNERVQPALAALGRELILRRNLSDLKRSQNSASADHGFLQALPIKARHEKGYKRAIRSILSISVDHLKLEGATLLMPERRLQVSAGNQPLAKGDGERIFKQLTGFNGINQSQIEAAHAKGIEMSGLPGDVRAWPVLDDRKKLIGLLLLAWPKQAGDTNDNAISLAGFVVTTIELVLERAFDPLTGLLNWPAFESTLARAYEDRDAEYTLMYLDIDQLHVVNDTFGRSTGDKVVRRFAGILRDMLKEHMVSRITGDAFAAVLTGLSIDDTKKLAEEICAKVPETDYALEGKTYRPTVSIGVSPMIRDSEGVRGALVPAQISCQAAKDRGRNRVEAYEVADQSIVQRIDDLQMIGSVRSAIEDGRLALFAQPIVRLDGDNSVAYHEILVRMIDKKGNAVEPKEFLGSAERYQLMQELDRWVVSNAIKALELYQLNSDQQLRLAINLSGQSVGNDQFLEFLKSELAQTSITTQRLCFEVTENVAVQNIKKATAFMEEIKALGCEFALDDFGTGQSSFTYLKIFPIDKLKIDGSFVADICENPVSRAMVKAIADVARVMEIETVAEYVQSQSVLEAIREIGLDWAQGYLLGEPVKLSDLLEATDLLDADTALNKSDLPL